MIEDFDRCYRAMESRDQRFDGWFYVAVTSTGIYCRPSCPARTPRRSNVRMFATAGAAHEAGFRACKRCRPDAVPGSPEWNVRADAVARAMRLIDDGVVDREGVAGLAGRLGYSPRHLTRLMSTELGAGPLAIARAQRARTARVLIETTDLPLTDVAFAAGFASVRQFNDTVREVFAATPTDLRAAAARMTAGPGTLALRLPLRAPFDAGVVAFLAERAVSGVEAADGDTYRRVLRLPNGLATVALRPAGDHVDCRLRLDDMRDLATAVARCRRLLDLDADPVAIGEALGGDPLLAPLVAARPGVRVPGTVDGAEIVVRAILGQQVSVAAARTVAGRIAARCGTELHAAEDGLVRAFPTPGQIAEADLGAIGITRARERALRSAAEALACGDVVVDAGADREATVAALVALPGIGPWTARYVAMRALGDPDVFLETDLGVRRALEALGADARPPSAAALGAHWRPWRSYALMYLWAAVAA